MLDALKERWWVAWIIILALVLLLTMRSQPTKIETRVVTHEVIKWRTHETLRTLPGAVITLAPDGTKTISGPVEISSTSEGDASKTSDTHTVQSTRVRAYHVLCGAGALLPRAEWTAFAGANIGHLFFLDIGGFIQVQAPLGSYLPKQFGLGVLATF